MTTAVNAPKMNVWYKALVEINGNLTYITSHEKER